MGSKQIYNQTMIEDLSLKLDDTMIKLDSVVTAMNNVNTAVSQGVEAINVKPGAGKTITFAHGDKSFSGALGVKSTVVSFRASCSGIVTFTCNVKTNTASNGGLFYQINSGADNTVVNYLTPANSWVQKVFNVPVTKGDIVNLRIMSDNTGVTFYLKDGTQVSYSVVDIVNEGAITMI